MRMFWLLTPWRDVVDGGMFKVAGVGPLVSGLASTVHLRNIFVQYIISD
jgi:hypothetical protein